MTGLCEGGPVSLVQEVGDGDKGGGGGWRTGVVLELCQAKVVEEGTGGGVLEQASEHLRVSPFRLRCAPSLEGCEDSRHWDSGSSSCRAPSTHPEQPSRAPSRVLRPLIPQIHLRGRR